MKVKSSSLFFRGIRLGSVDTVVYPSTEALPQSPARSLLVSPSLASTVYRNVRRSSLSFARTDDRFRDFT